MMATRTSQHDTPDQVDRIEMAAVMEQISHRSVRADSWADVDLIQSGLVAVREVQAWCDADARLVAQCGPRRFVPAAHGRGVEGIARISRPQDHPNDPETLTKTPRLADAFGDSTITADHIDAVTRAYEVNTAQSGELRARRRAGRHHRAAPSTRSPSRFDLEVDPLQDDGLDRLDQQRRNVRADSWVDLDGMSNLDQFDPSPHRRGADRRHDRGHLRRDRPTPAPTTIENSASSPARASRSASSSTKPYDVSDDHRPSHRHCITHAATRTSDQASRGAVRRDRRQAPNHTRRRLPYPLGDARRLRHHLHRHHRRPRIIIPATASCCSRQANSTSDDRLDFAVQHNNSAYTASPDTRHPRLRRRLRPLPSSTTSSGGATSRTNLSRPSRVPDHCPMARVDCSLRAVDWRSSCLRHSMVD